MAGLIFAFKGTVAQKCLKYLQTDAEKVLLDSSKTAIDQLVRKILEGTYDYVVGMGSYSGRDDSVIHIEQQCTSQFRNQKDDLQVIQIPYFLKPTSLMKVSSHIGNSWCNLVSYSVLKQHPRVPYAFLHIPKNSDPGVAARTLDNQLNAL